MHKLNTRDAAQRLGVTMKDVQELCKSKIIPARKVKGRWRLDKEKLEDCTYCRAIDAKKAGWNKEMIEKRDKFGLLCELAELCDGYNVTFSSKDGGICILLNGVEIFHGILEKDVVDILRQAAEIYR